jgi:hypothetical protein
MRTSDLLAVCVAMAVAVGCSGTPGGGGGFSGGVGNGADGGSSHSGGSTTLGSGGTGGASGTECGGDTDCRLFDDYCGSCNCLALPKTAKDPICSGTSVNCFAAPCMSNRAVCVNGQCLAGGAGGVGS